MAGGFLKVVVKKPLTWINGLGTEYSIRTRMKIPTPETVAKSFHYLDSVPYLILSSILPIIFYFTLLI